MTNGRPKVGLIWAQAANGVIGFNGDMPWHLPEDLAHFSAVTAGHPVIMGRRTWESLPAKHRPLPGRTNIVISSVSAVAGGVTARSLPDALEAASRAPGGDLVWLIGGGTVYRQGLELADRIVITRIELHPEGDTWAPQPERFGFVRQPPIPGNGWRRSSTGLLFWIDTYQRNTNRDEEDMSTLKERMQSAVKLHLRASMAQDASQEQRDAHKIALTTVRNVLGEITTREKSGKTPIEMDDAAVTSLLQKEAAKRRDTAAIYTDAGESARAVAEIAEAEVIEAYLPEPLTEADVVAIVDEVIAGLKASGTELGPRAMGAVMKPVTAKVAGRFDGKAVSGIVRDRLAA